MKKKLAILGASYLQLPLVDKCRKLGIETHCFAWDKDAVCKNFADYYYPISVLDENSILEKCQEIEIDGITTIAMDICIPVINSIAEKMGLIGNSEFCSIATTDKGVMRNVFFKNSIPIPTFIETSSADEIDCSEISFPCIIKPVDRSGSLGVKLVCEKSEIYSAINEACEVSFQKKCLVEQFIEGQEISVESISFEGKHQILAITDKVITPHPYFVEIEHHQPAMISEKLTEEIRKLTIEILDSVEIKNGASHTEFIIDKNNHVFAIEIGSRMGGDFIGSDLVYLSTGFDFLKAVAHVALGDFQKWKSYFQRK